MVQFPRNALRLWFAATTSQASAFSPCNITGFFRIHDSFHDPLRVGSTGAAVALANGVTTRVSLRRTRHPSIVTRFNGQRLDGKPVSNEVARIYSELDERSWQDARSHRCGFPPLRAYATTVE